MLTSFVLRLATDGLDSHTIAGELLVVASGRRVIVRSAEELLAELFLARLASAATTVANPTSATQG